VDIQVYGEVDIWVCREVDIRVCGEVDIWVCGEVDIRVCGEVDIWVCGEVEEKPICCQADLLHLFIKCVVECTDASLNAPMRR
jgi:hypothetical protein